MGISVSKFLNTAQHFSGGRFLFANRQTPGSGEIFIPIGNGGIVGSENEAQAVLPKDITVTRIRVFVISNSIDADADFHFRDDGADVGTVTVTAGNAGPFDSGALSQAVASGSLVNLRKATDARTVGTLEIGGYSVEYTEGIL